MWGIPQATVIQNSYFDWLKGSVRTDNKRRTRLFSGANIQNNSIGCIFLARKIYSVLSFFRISRALAAIGVSGLSFSSLSKMGIALSA